MAATTFTDNSGITIPDSGTGTPYPAQLTVSGLGNNLTGLTVALGNFEHTLTRDIGIVLQSPAGQNVMLVGRIGGDTGGPINVSFDDASPNPAPSGSWTHGLVYRPGELTFPPITFSDAGAHAEPTTWTTTLSSFNGSNPNGVWKLFVQDFAGGDEGSIGSWSITATAVPEPQTYGLVAAAALGGFAIVRRRRSRR